MKSSCSRKTCCISTNPYIPTEVMEQKHIRLIERLAYYTAEKAFENENNSLFYGKSGAAVALFEAAGFLSSEKTEDAAALLMEQALLRRTENIGFADGLSGIGYALAYLMQCQYIENDIDKYFGKNRIIIQNALFRHIHQREPATSSSLEILHYLTSILRIHPDGNEKQLAGIIIEHAVRQLNERFAIDRWIKDNPCKPAVIDTFIALLKAIYRIQENGLRHLYNPDLFCNLIQTYASVYQEGYMAHYYTLGHYLGKVTEPADTQKHEIAKANRSTGIKGMQTHLLSFRKKKELFFLLPDDECGTTLLESIDHSLEIQLAEADKHDFSGMATDAANGTSAWLLYKINRENLRSGQAPVRFSQLLY